jgi:hypothetical protein
LSKPGDGVLANVGGAGAGVGLEIEDVREIVREEAAQVGLIKVMGSCFGGEGARTETERWGGTDSASLLVVEPGDAVVETGFRFTMSVANEFLSSFIRSFWAGGAELEGAGLVGTFGGDSVYGNAFLTSVKSPSVFDWAAYDCETERLGKVA